MGGGRPHVKEKTKVMTVDIGLLVIKDVSFYFLRQMLHSFGAVAEVSLMSNFHLGSLEGSFLALSCINILP